MKKLKEYSDISDRFIAERLYSLNKLLSWNGTNDQIQITQKLFDEYRKEAIDRGLNPDVLISKERRKLVELFTNSVSNRS
jgi:hypothetical protein